MRYMLIIGLLLFAGCDAATQQAQIQIQSVKAERKPFRKSSVVITTPKKYELRENKKGEYDPRPKVVLIDERAGKYELRWIGYDGKQKVVPYQRSDAIDALVAAKVEKNSAGKLSYKYLIQNLPQSPAYLSGFVVQTLASDILDEPIPIANDVFTGHMGSYIPGFNIGVWRRFAPMGDVLPRIEAGKSTEFTLSSSALPGIVECRATGGDLILKGAGEHMPTELENALPGYEVWATGYTIGPVESLAKFSKAEKLKYLLDNLAKFQEAGWMSSGTATVYGSILKREDLPGALKQAQKDLEKEFITSEVFHIIEGLANEK